jgi:hypothetical protein
MSGNQVRFLVASGAGAIRVSRLFGVFWHSGIWAHAINRNHLETFTLNQQPPDYLTLGLP